MPTCWTVCSARWPADATATLAGVGLMISPNERFGIKLAAQVLSPVQGASGGLYLGAGTGGVSTGAGISTYSSIYQFGFFGALTFSFPQ